jgi:Ser/Thr protein kinase RdoA (MazF antagonist)
MLENILAAFGIGMEGTTITIFGTGLINNTWLVKSNKGNFILQRINHAVFKQPADIAENIKNIAAYITQSQPSYFFVTPCPTVNNQEILHVPAEGYFRLFPFVKNSHTIDVVHTISQAYEAAKQFGLFTKVLVNFPIDALKVTLPHFHNLSLRYMQFENALQNGNAERINQSTDAITFIKLNKSIVHTFEDTCNNIDFKKRVTHHDTKISNVLFDDTGIGLCIIDLDTVMPGYFISDVGDMLRTYLSPVSEEEKDFTKIEIREDYFAAIANGYLGQLKDELTDTEKNHFIYAGKFLIYMQALRFLTDYLNEDVYYGSKYDGHNFVRACNQITLLQKLIEKETRLQEILLCN